MIPLLFLPGLLSDEAVWQNQLNGLKNMANCQVADLTQHDRIEVMARAAVASAPALFALAGISMGGYVALEILRQAPGRVLKLCLLDTSARADTSEQAQRRRMLMAMAREGQFRGVTPRLLPTLLHPDHVLDGAIVGLITSMAERVGRDAFLRQQNAILTRIDSRSFLKDIHAPTTLICGQQDKLTPPELMQEMADAIPGSRLSIIDRCGHLSTIERPDEVTQKMRRWLET